MSGIGISEETVKKMNNGANIVSDFAKLVKKFSEEFSDRKNKSATEDFNVELLENKARQIREHKFKIVVCGRFISGKSTFINGHASRQGTSVLLFYR